LEPVTHFLYGAAMSRAGFTRKTALATLTMTLAAEAPDIDMLWYFKGSAIGFVHHRGFTHTVFGIPVVAALVVALVFVLNHFYRRWRPLKPPSESASPRLLPRWGILYGLACLAGYSHLLLDFTNNYGIRPLWPFLNRWVAWDIVSIIEPLLLVFLIAGLVLPALFGLVNSEIGARTRGPRGRGGAITALMLVAIVWGYRDYQHRRAENAMYAVLYNGKAPIRVGAFPYALNPFHWHGVVDTGTTFESVPVRSSPSDVDPEANGTVYYKGQAADGDTDKLRASKFTKEEIIRAAKASYLGGAYIDWARFPITEVEERANPTTYVVSFRDLRYAYPEMRGTPLSAYIVLDSNLRSVDEGFYTHNPIRSRLENTPAPEDPKP
jgi:inner membrane protein